MDATGKPGVPDTRGYGSRFEEKRITKRSKEGSDNEGRHGERRLLLLLLLWTTIRNATHFYKEVSK